MGSCTPAASDCKKSGSGKVCCIVNDSPIFLPIHLKDLKAIFPPGYMYVHVWGKVFLV